MAKKNNKNRVVVITGASSGIGKATAITLASEGFKVYGLSRRTFEENNIISIACDVTKEEQVNEAISKIFEAEKRIDVLINNAGFGISGSVENQDIKKVEELFNVNFFGAFRITQKVLPIMRAQGFGKIINTSSVAGIAPIPFQSFYSATKASLDIWANALRLELKPFNIEVCNCLVGDTKTGFTAVRDKSLSDKDTVYEEAVVKSINKMEKDEQNGSDPTKVAKTILKLINKRKMPATKVVGGLYKFLLFLIKLLPQRIVLFVVGKMYKAG